MPLKSGSRSSPATYNQALAALRAYAKFAVREGYWKNDPTRDVALVREPAKDPDFLLIPEVHDFFRAVHEVSDSRWRSRDLAILAIAFAVGLRVSELERLNVEQIDFRTATIVRLRRKGERIQSLPFEEQTSFLLQRWINERSRTAAPHEPALFVSERKGRLSVRSFERLFERLRKHLRTPKHVTPHTARHTFVTTELDLGADITVVSRLAGHASIVTTMGYRHLLERGRRTAVALLGTMIPSELARPSAILEAASRQRSGQLTFQFPELLEHMRSPRLPANDALDAQENLDDTNAAA